MTASIPKHFTVHVYGFGQHRCAKVVLWRCCSIVSCLLLYWQYLYSRLSLFINGRQIVYARCSSMVGKLYIHISGRLIVYAQVFQRRVTLKARACGDQILSRMALVYCRRWVQFLVALFGQCTVLHSLITFVKLGWQTFQVDRKLFPSTLVRISDLDREYLVSNFLSSF